MLWREADRCRAWKDRATGYREAGTHDGDEQSRPEGKKKNTARNREKRSRLKIKKIYRSLFLMGHEGSRPSSSIGPGGVSGRGGRLYPIITDKKIRLIRPVLVEVLQGYHAHLIGHTSVKRESLHEMGRREKKFVSPR